MTTRRLLGPVMWGVVGFACAGVAYAQNTNLSRGKTYAYFKMVPGQAPNHYFDDGPINGLHKVHTTGLMTYGPGNLTDGAISQSCGTGPGTTHIGVRGPQANAPAADIIIDLGKVSLVTDFVLGTVVAAGLNNNAPDDVTISYSVTSAGPYRSARYYDLEKLYGPLSDGHHDMLLKVGRGIPARFVKFAFDGGSMKEPNGQDPDEKWMLDEITILGGGSSCTARSVNYGRGLAGKNGVPTLTVSAPPRFSTTIQMRVSNSAGAPTVGIMFLGLQEATIPLLGGTLLVLPLGQGTLTVPAAGLSFPVAIPGPPCDVPICLQFLQVDSAAVGGVSMTAGLRLDIGK